MYHFSHFIIMVTHRARFTPLLQRCLRTITFLLAFEGICSSVIDENRVLVLDGRYSSGRLAMRPRSRRRAARSGPLDVQANVAGLGSRGGAGGGGGGGGGGLIGGTTSG